MTTTTDYAGLVERWRRLAVESTPHDAQVAVVSRGDAALLAVAGRRIRHFPADAAGQWVGHHPADGNAALAELRRARAAGVTHLAVPATSRWWMDHYPEFAQELATGASVVGDDPSTAAIYELSAMTPPDQRHQASPSASASASEIRAALNATTSHRQQHHLIQLLANTPRAVLGGRIGVGCPPALVHAGWASLMIDAAPDDLVGISTLVVPAAHRAAWDPRVASRAAARTLFDRADIGRAIRFVDADGVIDRITPSERGDL